MNRTLPLILLLATATVLGCKKEKEDRSIKAAPSLQLPVNGATSVSHFPTFSWNSVENANSYEIQTSFSGSSFSGSDLKDNSIPSGTTYRNSTLDYTNGAYFWRVRALGSEGTGPWSEVRTFVVDSNSPDAPGPDFGTIILYDNDLPSGVSYTIQMSLNSPQTLSCAGPSPMNCSVPSDCSFVRFTGIYDATYYVTGIYASGPNAGTTAFTGAINGSLGYCQRTDIDDL